MFCRSLFILLCFFFWPLCGLPFFSLQILITPLVSSNSFFHFHDRYVVDKTHSNSCLCVSKSHYIDCLIKEFGVDNSIWQLTIYLDDSNEIGTVITSWSRPVLSSLEISSNDEELDLLLLYRMPNCCVIVLTNNAILLDLPKCHTKHLSILLTSHISKPGWTVTVKRDTKGVVRIRRGSWKILKVC